MFERSNILAVICFAILFSGCVSKPFGQIESEWSINPARATFTVPPPCTYIAPMSEPAALVGTWSTSGTMERVEHSSYTFSSGLRISYAWEYSYTFSPDGSFSIIGKFNGHSERTVGRWSYSNGLLVLDREGEEPLDAHREYRLHWLDSQTFDVRWASDSAEAVWWKAHLDGGMSSFVGWNNSVVVTYDSCGCKRRTSRMRDGNTGVIIDMLFSPERYRCMTRDRSISTGAGAVSEVLVPASGNSQDGAPVSSSIVEIDFIPL